VLTIALAAASAAAAQRSITLAGRRGPRARLACEIALAWTTLAGRSLLAEANAVRAALEHGDLPAARLRLARIVGRETAELDASEIARATIETLAESLGDGIAAPLCALALGGVPAAFAFKAVSTLDSMIGHREAPYAFFGRIAARTDDALNFLPARAAAWAVAAVAPVVGGSPALARAIVRRDAAMHASPNGGRLEAAAAGALRVRLGGVNRYDGVAHAAARLGTEFRDAAPGDVARAMRLVAAAACLLAAVAIGVRLPRGRGR